MSEDTDTHTERFLNIEKPFKTDNRFTASLTKAPAKSIHLTELITFLTEEDLHVYNRGKGSFTRSLSAYSLNVKKGICGEKM